MVDKIKCCEVMTSFQGGWPNSHRCIRNATTEHDGKFYCKQHNPALRKEKADAKYQAYKAEWSAKYDKRVADAHKIAVHDELVAVLEMARSEIWTLLDAKGVAPKDAILWPEIVTCDAAILKAKS
jgi:hypothetical protein